MRALSPRVQALHERFRDRYAALGTRLYAEPSHATWVSELLLQSYRDTVGQPVILRRAAALEHLAASLPLVTEAGDLLLGTQTFNPPTISPAWARTELQALGYAGTTGHIVHDYAVLLRRGVQGLLADVAQARAGVAGPQILIAQAFTAALTAFSTFVARHAESRPASAALSCEQLRHLASQPPQTFAQALQLVWFAQIFLHLENPSMAISFGRLDQYLWPFLKRDLDTGCLTAEAAFELVCAFCLKCCEGEESQNLTLGGFDADGADQSNLLSVMLLEAIEALRCHQPSLTVRWRPGHHSPLTQAACRLAASGTGQPGFMNDAVMARALQAAGVPADRARDWAIIGCYEAAPQGDCYPNTVLGGLHLPAALAEYLDTATATTFEAFTAGFLTHLEKLYTGELQRLGERWASLRDHAPSPFGSTLLGGCLEALAPLEAGAAPCNLVGLDIQGLGTLVDSLHVIRSLVYQEQALALPALAAAVRDDFPDEALRQRCRAVCGRYGSDSPATNDLAATLSNRIARMVLDSRLPHGVRPYPAFFRFSADIYDLRVASPDGRRREDLISYGVGPSSTLPASPTAVLRSAAHVAHDLCGCGNPLALTLPHPSPPARETAGLIHSLVDTYFTLGGQHVHFNTPSAADLRAARAHPDQHADLLIRVSGFSARFIRLDPRWQDALIQRTEQGL